MTVTSTPRLMTAAEFLALPDDDGVERWLINGELREEPMTRRNRWHSRVTIRIGRFLDEWACRQPEPQGGVFGGEVGCWLSRDPATLVGIDVAYFDAATLTRTPVDASIIEGPPVLAVEILSPSDTVARIDERIDSYLLHGVKVVWIVDPHDRSVTLYRPGREPETVNAGQELNGGAELPGFRVGVAELFAG